MLASYQEDRFSESSQDLLIDSTRHSARFNVETSECPLNSSSSPKGPSILFTVHQLDHPLILKSFSFGLP